MALPAYTMGQVNLLDFSPIENALGRAMKQRQLERDYAMQQERMGMDRERLGFEKANFDEQQRRREELGRILDPTNPSFRDAPPQLVELSRAMRDPAPIVQHYVNSQKGTDDIKEFEYAQKRGFTGQFQEWMNIKRKGGVDYGKQGAIFQGEDGQFYSIQFASNGDRRIEPVTRDGRPLRPAKGVKQVGDELVDIGTGAPVRNVAPNIENKEAAEEIGKRRGQSIADLPRVIDNAQQALDTITQIREHPGKKYGVGIPGVLGPVPGTVQAGFVDLVDQAKGKAFLEAFNSLKGGGQITEVEGTKATQAIARLQRARRPEDFDKALSDLEAVIQAGLIRAYRAAGRQPGQPPAERVNSGPGIPVAPQQAAPPAAPQPAPLPAQQRVSADPPREAIDDLMRNPSEQMKRFFEDHFKLPRGAADDYLKGRR